MWFLWSLFDSRRVGQLSEFTETSDPAKKLLLGESLLYWYIGIFILSLICYYCYTDDILLFKVPCMIAIIVSLGLIVMVALDFPF